MYTEEHICASMQQPKPGQSKVELGNTKAKAIEALKERRCKQQSVLPRGDSVNLCFQKWVSFMKGYSNTAAAEIPHTQLHEAYSLASRHKEEISGNPRLPSRNPVLTRLEVYFEVWDTAAA